MKGHTDERANGGEGWRAAGPRDASCTWDHGELPPDATLTAFSQALSYPGSIFGPTEDCPWESRLYF